MGTSFLTVPVSLQSLSDLALFVTQAAEAAGLSRQASYRLRLAVDELSTNVFLHGGPAAVAGSLNVSAEVDDSSLRLVLEDCGAPFDPRQVPAPADLHLPAEQRQLGGLGIYLALQGIDGFFYERVGDRNRNILVMNRLHPSTPRS